MIYLTLSDLQTSVQNKQGYIRLSDYLATCEAFLEYIHQAPLTRIVSPKAPNYIFYQYHEGTNHNITRPLNSDLFIASPPDFLNAYERFLTFLGDLQKRQDRAVEQPAIAAYIQSGEANRVVYTLQQTIGCIGDAFANPNQSRKRIRQLFESLVRLIIQEIGVTCEPRTVRIPIPGNPGYVMSYELDLVFSRDKAIIASETKHIHPSEIVGSVKTTSKDRIDKIFLDKYLLARLLGREIPVVAIFLHDVQRASTSQNRRSAPGATDFGIASTFKKNHFLGYTVALNRLDGVYYVDPRPEMLVHEKLREQIRDFQQFLVADLWALSHVTEDAHDLQSLAYEDTAAMAEADEQAEKDAEDSPENDVEDASNL
jgi:hypothetical protein